MTTVSTDDSSLQADSSRLAWRCSSYIQQMNQVDSRRNHFAILTAQLGDTGVDSLKMFTNPYLWIEGVYFA